MLHEKGTYSREVSLRPVLLWQGFNICLWPSISPSTILICLWQGREIFSRNDAHSKMLMTNQGLSELLILQAYTPHAVSGCLVESEIKSRLSNLKPDVIITRLPTATPLSETIWYWRMFQFSYQFFINFSFSFISAAWFLLTFQCYASFFLTPHYWFLQSTSTFSSNVSDLADTIQNFAA